MAQNSNQLENVNDQSPDVRLMPITVRNNSKKRRASNHTNSRQRDTTIADGLPLASQRSLDYARRRETGATDIQIIGEAWFREEIESGSEHGPHRSALAKS